MGRKGFKGSKKGLGVFGLNWFFLFGCRLWYPRAESTGGLANQESTLKAEDFTVAALITYSRSRKRQDRFYACPQLHAFTK